MLQDRGYPAEAYTGQTDPEQRLHIEESLLTNKLKAVVATSALGMGYDKPDLGFIVHLGAPQSPVAYYQQIGRAGRGVRRADVVLLPGREDRDIWAYFGSLAFPAERVVRAVLGALESAGRTLSTAALAWLVSARLGADATCTKLLRLAVRSSAKPNEPAVFTSTTSELVQVALDNVPSRWFVVASIAIEPSPSSIRQ